MSMQATKEESPIKFYELYNALSIKERAEFFPELKDVSLTNEEAETILKDWKDKALLTDEDLKNKLVNDQIDADLFSKILKTSESGIWIHNYVATEVPLWMKSLNEALILNRETKYEHTPENNNIGIAVRPFLLWAKKRFNTFFESDPWLSEVLDVESVLNSILINLAEGLVEISARTLVLEMHVAKQLNELEGDSPEERYQSFVQKKLCNFEGLEFIYKEYPVLSRILIQRTQFYIQSITEALSRFKRDYSKISTLLKGDHPILVTIVTGLGDSHQEGRSVMRFKFHTDEEVLYKPKPLTIAVHFNQFLEWMNTKGFSPSLRGYNIIDCQEYAWEEFVHAEGCETEQEVENYFKRIGGLLAILHVLNGTDFHHENIIAKGEFPTLIDLETLFHHVPNLKIEETAEVRAKLKVVNSVLGTALLPQLAFKNAEGKGIDISGMSAKEQMLPISVLQVENEGTDEMRFVRKQKIMKVDGNNVPNLKGKNVDATRYVDSINEGFKKAAKILLVNRNDLLGDHGLLGIFKDDEIRIVVRPTQYYANFVMESQHPDYMRNCVDRERLFDRIWFTVLDKRQIPFETIDLMNGDIPFFTTNPSNKDLVSSLEKRIPDFFSVTSYQTSVERIMNLTEESIEQQAEWITASLIANSQNSHETLSFKSSKPITSEKVDISLFMKEANDIGQYLLDRAIYGKRNDATWIGLDTNYYGQWQVTALEKGLYNGLSGISLFLAYLGKVTQTKEYDHLAMQALETILHAPVAAKGLGSAFYGKSSIVYTISHFQQLYGENKVWSEYMGKLINVLGRNIETDKLYDLLGGSAGIIQVLLNIYEQFNLEEALNISIQYGNHLVKNKKSLTNGCGWIAEGSTGALGGFSHGVSGISWSLLRLYHVTKKQEFFDTAIEAIQYDRSLFNSHNKNWKDLRAQKEGNMEYEAAWCHGSSGIGLSRILSMPYYRDDMILNEIETAVNTTLRIGMGRSHSLCHGDLGNAELLYTAGLVLDKKEWVKKAQLIGMDVIKEKQIEGKYKTGIKNNVSLPGLFLGLSGIGYQLLRLADSRQVPSVLALEGPLRLPGS